MIKKFSSKNPGRLLLAIIILTITVGVILLSLPISQNSPIPFIDILFTTTSTATVTGLLTVPIKNFTIFGQFIIFVLMQLGGLGLMTMTLLLISFVINMGLSTQLIAGQILEINKIKQVKRIFLFILTLTAIVELIGAISTFLIIYKDYELKTAIFYSAFHSISSFCNAGITLFPNGIAYYNHNLTMLIITSMLMLIGSIGFITWYEIAKFLRAKFIIKKFFSISLQTKIVISFTTVLIIIGAIIFYTLEANNSLLGFSTSEKIINSIFSAISLKSTGFLTVNFVILQLATILYIFVSGFIGAAPGSTGSGIKVTVFAIAIATMKSVITGRRDVEIFGRSIAHGQIYKALTIIILSISWIITVTFFLLITEKSFSFLDILFETLSAFVNLGVSSGITGHLSFTGKLFLTTTMIVGRIGSLTLALAFLTGSDKVEFSYPEERIMLS